MLRSLPAVLFCFVLLFSASFAQDPGDPDQLIVGADGMGPGETAVIPITISCDSDVGHITIPMSFDGVDRRSAGDQRDAVPGVGQARTQIPSNCSGAKD